MALVSTNFLYLLVLGAYLASVDASDIVCSNRCPVVHPQQHFCNADSAYKVKILSTAFVNDHHQIVLGAESIYVRYEAKVLTSLKGASWVGVGTTFYFYTPSGFTCSISTLDKQGIYLIAGKVRDGMLIVTDCDGLAIQWSDLTENQLAGVKGKYEAQCSSCQIRGVETTLYIGGEKAELGEESGFWSKEGCFFNPIPSMKYGGEDCETLYSYCTPPAGGSTTTTTCSWKETPEYRDCSELRESTWFLMEKAQPAYTCRSQCKGLPNQNLRYKCLRQIKKLERKGYAPC